MVVCLKNAELDDSLASSFTSDNVTDATARRRIVPEDLQRRKGKLFPPVLSEVFQVPDGTWAANAGTKQWSPPCSGSL